MKDIWMRKRFRVALKLLLIAVCVFSFVWLIRKDEKEFQLTQPQGDGIAVEDAVILIQALSAKDTVPSGDSERMKEWADKLAGTYAQGRAAVLYEDYAQLAEGLEMEETCLKKDSYRNEFYLVKEDWYEMYDALLNRYGMKDRICLKEMNLLAKKEECILDDEGAAYRYRSGEFEECLFSGVEAYLDGEELLTVKKRRKDPFTLENLWIMETGQGKLQFFYEGAGMDYACREGDCAQEAERETVADFTFREGRLSEIKIKKDRINGRILRFTGEKMEIEGEGIFSIAGNCRLYQLYEELREAGWEEIGIGYDFTDFVVEKGKICAGLITRKENMENIRVAVKSNGFSSLYHEKILLKADCEMSLIYGPYGSRSERRVGEGDEVLIEPDSDYLKGDRMEVIPAVKSGKIQVTSLSRNQGSPAYRGKLEITKEESGLVLINELLLEEYLYSVVPSEMPASYSMEALKAQAVCARTYAYRYLTSPGLAPLGAHVDDSVSYQVYNNVEENVNSTTAVKETMGELLYYKDEAVSTYYYSTSCGFGTDAGIWSEDNREEMPYLSGIHIAKEEGEEAEARGQREAQKMTDEAVFREFIQNAGETDYEKDEAWYRWEYGAAQLDAQRMSTRLKERYRADSGKVLTLAGEDEPKEPEAENVWMEREVKDFSEVYHMEILERREGGVADSLLLETDSGSYLIRSEYNIRYILNNGGSVKRQDGTQVESASLLPSAYLVMDIEKEGECVVGYSIFGGGYGHGVGMSQNGARAMAGAGKNCGEILSFFYPGCEIKKIY